VLRLWNKFEDLNNKLYLFPLLLHYITQKGHTYVIKDEKPYKTYDNITMNDIIEAKNICHEEYECLLDKQQKGMILQKERFSLEKYYYAQIFNVYLEDIDLGFMKKHYNKIGVYYNNRDFIDYWYNGFEENTKHGNKFDNQNKFHRMKCIQDVILELGFDNLDCKVEKKDFDKNISDMLKLINSNFRMLFGMKKAEVDNLIKIYKVGDTNNKPILGFINKLIGEYGYKIKAIWKAKYNKKTKKMDSSIITHYKINILEILNKE